MFYIDRNVSLYPVGHRQSGPVRSPGDLVLEQNKSTVRSRKQHGAHVRRELDVDVTALLLSRRLTIE